MLMETTQKNKGFYVSKLWQVVAGNSNAAIKIG